jgi:DNA polymerase-3 subunit beta
MSNPTRKSAGVSKRIRKPKTALQTKLPAAKPAGVYSPSDTLPASTPIRTGKKRGRPSNAEKAARLAASQPAPAGSNGDHPKTLQAVAASPLGFLLKVGDWAREAATIEQAQGMYLQRMTEVIEQADGNATTVPAGELFGPAGTRVGRIDHQGRAYQLDGKQIGSFMTAPQSTDAPASEELEPATVVTVPVKYLAAALAIAPKKDTRYYLNAVYLQQLGDSLRIVATDGHRLLVIATEEKKVLPWGEAGLLIPRDELERVVKFVGKTNARGEGSTLEISYGRNHPVVKLNAPADIGSFSFSPVDGKYPDYQKIVESAGAVMAVERSPTETSAIQSAYMKSAGVIAAQLESDSVFSFMGGHSKQACVFTFAGEPGALLYIQPFASDRPALQSRTVQLIGEVGMARSLAALKAHETRCREAAKSCDDQKAAEALIGKANVFLARADEIRAMLAVKLTGPTSAKPAQEEAGAEA